MKVFHVKQSMRIVRARNDRGGWHEAQTNVAPRFSFPLDGKGRVFSYDGVSHEGQQLDR